MVKKRSCVFSWQEPITVSGSEPPKFKRRKKTPKERHHDQSEWSAQRERIEELYQKHGLADVARIMREEEGFNASISQYRHQLEKWGTSWKYLILSLDQKLFIKEKAVERAMDLKPRMAARLYGKKIPSSKLSKVLKDIMNDPSYGSVKKFIDSKIARDATAQLETEGEAVLSGFGDQADTIAVRNILEEHLHPKTSTRATETETPQDVFKIDLMSKPTQKVLEIRVDNSPEVGASWSQVSTFHRGEHRDDHGLSVYSCKSTVGASIPHFPGMPSLTKEIASISREMWKMPQPSSTKEIASISRESWKMPQPRTKNDEPKYPYGDVLRRKAKAVVEAEKVCYLKWISSIPGYRNGEDLVRDGRSLQLMIFQKEVAQFRPNAGSLEAGDEVFTAALLNIYPDTDYKEKFWIERQARYAVLPVVSNKRDQKRSKDNHIDAICKGCGGILFELYHCSDMDEITSPDIKTIITYSVRASSDIGTIIPNSKLMMIAPLRERRPPMRDMKPNFSSFFKCGCVLSSEQEVDAYCFSRVETRGNGTVNPVDTVKAA